MDWHETRHQVCRTHIFNRSQKHWIQVLVCQVSARLVTSDVLQSCTHVARRTPHGGISRIDFYIFIVDCVAPHCIALHCRACTTWQLSAVYIHCRMPCFKPKASFVLETKLFSLSPKHAANQAQNLRCHLKKTC